MIVTIIEIILIIILLFLSALFSSTETALFSMDEMKIRLIKKRDDKKRIKNLLKNSSIVLITILFSNMLVNTAVSSLLERKLSFHNSLVSILIITLILLISGEITPKTVAILKTEQIASLNTKLFMPIYYAFMPISKLLNKFVELNLKIIKSLSKNAKSIKEDEKNKQYLSALINIVSKENIFDRNEKYLIENVLQFTNREVWNIMTPRTKIVSVEKRTPLDKVIEKFKVNKISKMPVYSETNDNIIGVIYLSSIFNYIYNPEKIGDKVAEDIMEEMYYVPETKKLSEMLEDFKQKKIKIATVVDEYGNCLGIVTITDLLGEIVGELMDEEFSIHKKISKIGKNKYSVKGDVSIIDFNSYFKTNLKSENYETLAGYVIEQFGDIPDIGNSLNIDGYTIRVVEKTDKNITDFIVEKMEK